MHVVLFVGRRPIYLDVRLARTQNERIQGFSGRTALFPNEAILFAFPHDTIQPFTMSGTFVSLDMMFFDRDGRLVWKFQRTVPGRLSMYLPPVSYRYALEVPGGWARANGVGDQAVVTWNSREFTQPI